MTLMLLFEIGCVVLFAFGCGFWCGYTVFRTTTKSEEDGGTGIPVAPHEVAILKQEYAPAVMRDLARPKLKNLTGADIPYEEVGPMFVDQFLLVNFHDIIKPLEHRFTNDPWRVFCKLNPWAERMPRLFKQATGLDLTDRQLAWAADEVTARLAQKQEVSDVK